MKVPTTKTFIMGCAFVVLCSKSLHAERLISVGFLSSSYQGCTGHCEKETINCTQGSQEHGSTKWCEKNCVNRGKVDEYQFMQGIKPCLIQKDES